ncbi:unnamed protein product, partial [Medioppia subpectinata]
MRFELMPKQYFLFFSYTFILFGTSICQYDRYGGSNHDQNHDRDRHQDRDRYDNKDRYNNHDRYGSGNQYGGSGQYGSGASAESCIEKAGYSVRTCEDTLIDRQREVKAKSTNAMDVQHGVCCALYFYRDCIGRVVSERCRESSSTIVDTMMGPRKWDITLMCRDYFRDQCSRSSQYRSSSITPVLSILI